MKKNSAGKPQSCYGNPQTKFVQRKNGAKIPPNEGFGGKGGVKKKTNLVSIAVQNY